MTRAWRIAVLALLVAAAPRAAAAQVTAVAVSGQPAPGGGTFEHFSVESLPIVAPVNGKGQVAFFATLLRGAASEGIFLATGARVARVALEGDPAPGGGTISGFGRHPIPALNESGAVAFAAAVAGGRTVEGIFIAARGKLQAVAVAGAVAPGIPSGTFANVDSPVAQRPRTTWPSSPPCAGAARRWRPSTCAPPARCERSSRRAIPPRRAGSSRASGRRR